MGSVLDDYRKTWQQYHKVNPPECDADCKKRAWERATQGKPLSKEAAGAISGVAGFLGPMFPPPVNGVLGSASGGAAVLATDPANTYFNYFINTMPAPNPYMPPYM